MTSLNKYSAHIAKKHVNSDKFLSLHGSSKTSCVDEIETVIDKHANEGSDLTDVLNETTDEEEFVLKIIDGVEVMVPCGDGAPP